MSLIKNLKRKEVEIFGAKRIVRNDTSKNKTEEVKVTKKSKKKKTEVQ
ncbi:MAG: hypothetical protein IKL68_02160 [Clostridia bacterium]|nr:hypothetical protein [Clostridia bacterium]